MSSHLNEWFSLALRWLHVIAGIVWIGESFYFMWLDSSLKRDDDMPPEVAGESWSVHGGGFYRVAKFRVAPTGMPEGLHWFKWEAYTTWISGIFLLMVVYWLQASAWMVNADGINPAMAVGVGMTTILAGWGVYDLLCKSKLGDRPAALGVTLLLFATGVAYVLSHLLAPRAAYIHVGAMIGTWMAGNVAMVIIPNQKIVVADLLAGRTPDAKYGKIAKLRSTHNNYLTLPVVFVMISNHYPSTYGHSASWAILLGIFAVGAITRVFFNARNAGRINLWALPVATALFIALVMLSAPQPRDAAPGPATWEQVAPIIQTHCVGCHSANPTDPIFTIAPNGVVYDTPEQVSSKASAIQQRAVDTPTMPLGNRTGMTDAERATLGAWIAGGARIP